MPNINNLLNYYIECVEIESLEDLTFPSFKEKEKYAPYPNMTEWSATDEQTIEVTLPGMMKNALTLGRGASSLYYGWPIFVVPQVAANGNEYSWIEPVFFLKVEYEIDGTKCSLSLLKEWPKINNKILQRLTDNIEGRIQLVDELGLSEAETLGDNGLLPYWESFIKRFPELKVHGVIQVTPLINANIDICNIEGYYNRAILMVTDAPRYSRGLLRELRSLNDPGKISQLASTSLHAFLEGQPLQETQSFHLSQISKLNRSQRQATVGAFGNQLSVITGPPGTGKSQVVLNIIANAFENNQSVLFTSKNNKAVDVVCGRIFEAVQFPINLRLGAKTTNHDYTTEFLDLLDSILAGGDRNEIETTYNHTKKQYEENKKTLFSFLEQLGSIVKNRNRINELDQACKDYEEIIDEVKLLGAQEKIYKDSDLIEQAKKELIYFETNKVPFVYKLIGLISKTYPYKKLHSLCEESNRLIGNLIDFPAEIIPSAKVYADFIRQAEKIYEYIKIHSEIRELRENLKHLDINMFSEIVEKEEEIFIKLSKAYLAALGRYRMINLSAEQRKCLTNYYAVIRQLAGDYPGNKAYAKLKKQQELLFEEVKKILPIWSVTNLSAGGNFPFSSNIFDVVIIDEASQSDIASALPLLFRAKKAAIIGDPQQLRHIAAIRRSQDNRLLQKYDLLQHDTLRFSYSAQSLYDCARGAVGKENVTFLNEHYRSHFSIIEFSNREWYNGYLDIRTNYSDLVLPPDGRQNIEWINVAGNTVRPGRSALNKIEADKVLEILKDVFSSYGENVSVGIVTPFVAQKEYIFDKIVHRYDSEFIKQRFLLANTAHQFQGDERDVIIFSPVISQGAQDTTVGFLRSTSNLFNVAITRARSILWVVGDRERCINSGVSYLRNFVEYIDHSRYENIDLPYREFQSPWEKKFYEILTTEGYSPRRQYSAGPYFIDIALINDHQKLGIEIDGAFWHSTMTGERLERDITRDRNLRRMGWEIIRFWVHDLKYDLDNCLKIVQERTEINR